LKASSKHDANSRHDLSELHAVIANQKALGRRLIILLVLPVFLTLGVVLPLFYIVTSRLSEVETGTQIVTIERILESDKNYPWAIDQYEQIAKLRPSAPTLARLGILHFLDKPNDSSALKKAIEELESAKQYNSEYWEIYRSLTFIYTQTAQTEKAIEAGERALKLNNYDANTYNNLAWLYATCEPEFRDLRKALAYSTRAVELTKRNNIQFLDTLAKVHSERSERELALKVLEDAAIKARTPAEVLLIKESMNSYSSAKPQ
jgi:tetratricopeptide (TPR) repeat protein